jgi:hypothetical protein
MEKPQLTDEHRKLERLSGDWVGEETISWTKAGKGTGTFSTRVALDGFFLVTDYVEESEGKVLLRGHGVFGWDSKERAYTFHWFDTFGSPPNRAGRGQWNGNALTFEHSTGRTTFQLDAPGALTFRVEMPLAENQGWQTAVEGKYRRR